MFYEQTQIKQAFSIFAKLSKDGQCGEDELRLYLSDDQVRDLVDLFAEQVECKVLSAGESLFLIPMASDSVFHIKNETLKRHYLRSGSTNQDIYLMYVAIVVLFGAFYNSYTSAEPSLDFISMSSWLQRLDEVLQALKEHGQEKLQQFEQDYEINWSAILEKWDALDDLRETAKVQDRRTNSRLGFLDSVKKFLEAQQLIQDIGNYELELSEKAKVIIQRFYMDETHHRGLLEFMYQWEERKE